MQDKQHYRVTLASAPHLPQHGPAASSFEADIA
jgi:hypothetical protein